RRRLIRRCRRTAGGNVHAPRRTGLDVIAIRSLGQGQRLPSLSPLRRRQCRDTAQPAVKLRHVHGSLLASQESAIADTNNQRHESHLNNTLSPEDTRLAAYYSRGAVVDTALLEAALAVASGEVTFSEAMDGLSMDYLRAGRDADLLDDWNMRTTDRLSALVARIEADRENGTDTLNASVAIIRPDIHPLVAKGLG